VYNIGTLKFERSPTHTSFPKKNRQGFGTCMKVLLSPFYTDYRENCQFRGA